MKQLDELLSESPFFTDLGDDMRTLLAGCARNVHFAVDQRLFHTGDAADRCYLVRRGRVALEMAGSGGRRVILDTVDETGMVGMSWLVPPYRWHLDARAVQPTDAIELDASCLRAKCEAEPRIGYLLLQRIANAMYERMESSALQLMDVYGAPRGN